MRCGRTCDTPFGFSAERPASSSSPHAKYLSLRDSGAAFADLLARDIDVARLRTANVSAQLVGEMVSAKLLGGAGVIGVLLASLGLYGVISYSVAQRTNEIGIRAALGAEPRDIIRLIVREAAAVLVIGSLLGLVLAVAALRITSHALIALPSADVATFLVVPALLAGVILLACYVPARRAARIDPMAALREL